MKKGPPRIPLAERFWAKVQRGDGCWLWTASLGTAGYGQIGGAGRGSRPLQAHRVAWELIFGPIPEGQWVLHRCDNKRCVRPDHLFLGDVGANNRDMYAKGRAAAQVAPERVIRRGIAHHKAKLTDAQVVEIRRLYGSGDADQPTLAKYFGVRQSTIGRIVRRQNWTHIPETAYVAE